MNQGTRAMVLAALMVVSVAAPAMGATSSAASPSVDVVQDDGVTVTVTNGTANDTIANASVDVTTVTENVTYAGAGSYTTGPNGTVGLSAPNQSLTVSVTATVANRSATTTANLTAAESNETAANETALPFGMQLVAFSSGLADTDGPRGLTIASWVTANNPGNGSGPPAWAGPGNETGNETSNATQGPPAHAGPDNGTQGPPAHAGPGNETGNATQGPPDHAGNDTNEDDETRGPPDHAGGGEDEADDETDEETDEDETDDEEEDGSAGPPDHAGGNGNGAEKGGGQP